MVRISVFNRILFFLLFLNSFSFGQSAEIVLMRVDKIQKDFKSLFFNATMEIQSGSRTVFKSFFGFYDQTNNITFIEYTNPVDKGMRYLMIEHKIWIYLPDIQDVLKLSGDLLKDSVMGGDLSYNDLMEQGSLSDEYYADYLLSTNIDNEDIYILTIKAKNNKISSYYMQDLFLYKNNFRIQKIIAYAKGRNGARPIKELFYENYINLGSLNMPTKITIKDLRKKNSKTVLTYSDLKVNIPLDERVLKAKKMIENSKLRED